MGTEKFIFEGPFYYPSKHEGGNYYKVNVLLNKITVHGDDQERFCLSITCRKIGSRPKYFVFSPSELCYVENAEDEQRIRHRFSLIDCYRKPLGLRLTLSTLCLVIKQHDREESVKLKFLQDSNFSRQSDNGLFKLYNVIRGIIGQQLEFFGHSVTDRVNGENERLVATRRNVCVLNSNMKVLCFYSVEEKKVIVSHDGGTELLTIDIREDCGSSATVNNFVRRHTIKFSLKGGEAIRDELQRLWNFSDYITPTLSGSYKSDLSWSRTANLSGSYKSDLSWSRTANLSKPCAMSESNHVSEDRPDGASHDVDQTIPKSIMDELPPPSPCLQNDTTFVSLLPDSSKIIPGEPLPKVPRGILKSQSYVNLKYQCLQDLKRDRPSENIYVDGYDIYAVYYTNTGWTRYHKSSMRKRIQRRSRLSNEIKDINFNTVDKHEAWFDQLFKGRASDENYRRVNKLYSNPQQLPLNISDDPYWNSELCLTIQYVLENKKPKLAEIFDLSFSKMAGVCVHLSIETHVRTKDWRYLAEELGLHSQDIEIIEHFCYKYRMWTTEVVLIHWVFQRRRKQNVPECSYDNLKDYIKKLERDDILKIIQSNSNENEEVEDFWEENTRM